MILRSLIVICILYVSCQSGSKKIDLEMQAYLTEAMAGTWRTKSLKVNIQTKNGGPENEVFLVTEKDFPKELKIKANIGTFKENGTYREAFIGLNDSIIAQRSGVWAIVGDTLVINQRIPLESNFRYKFVINGNQGSFSGYIDWDGDGAADDYITGVSEKIRQ